MPGTDASWKHAKSRLSLLTPPQREIAALIAEGASNQQIATRRQMSLNEAKSEVNHVLGRLELSSREDLAAFWFWQSRRRSVPLWLKLGGGLAALLIVAVAFAAALSDGDGETKGETGEASPTASGPPGTPTATVPPSLEALGLAPVEIPWPAPGSEGRLAFVNPAGELLVKPMPSGQAKIVREGDAHRTPAWAPSGKYLAFIESSHLVVSDEHGHLTPLTQPGVDASWGWSPTEDVLAYFSPDGMLLYDAATRAARVIRGQGAPYPERPGGLYWSPGGTMILYGVYAGYTSPGRLDTTELRVYELRTGNDTLLLEESIPAKGGTSPLGWSGDGRWVFYREPPGFGNSAWAGSVNVHVMLATGGPSKTLGAVDGIPEHVSVPVGPDLFAYVSGGFRFATDGGRRLMVVSNGVERELPGSPPGTVSALAISPNATRLASIAMPEPPPITGNFGLAEMLELLRSEKLWVQTIGLPAKTQLTNDPAFRDEHPVWSKDGKTIVFARIDAVGDASIWRIASSGGDPELIQDGLGFGERGVSGVYGWIEWSDLLAWWQPQ